jgi:pantothenate kinase
MDGYHHPRSYLSTLPPSLHAFARRGAPFTFNAPAYLSLITALRAPLTPSTPTIYAPSFDHAVKDPVENAIAIPPTAKICVFEGNYVALDKGEWKEAAEMMDEVWFVEVEEVVAERRLVERHVRTGVEETEERARVRVRGNDLVNGREIVGNRVKVDEVVRSVEEEGWRPVKAEGRG